MRRTLKTFGWALAIVTWMVLARTDAHAQAQAQNPGPIVPVGAKMGQSPLDQPLEWLYEAKRNYAVVRDYSCTLVSRENVRGKLQDENVIQLKMKTQPFSVSMRWIAPKRSQGQEVAFVLGKNNNKMRVKSSVLGNAIGFISLDPKDPRVLEHSRHNILEAGLGNMIDQTINHCELERRVGKVQVKIAEAPFNQRDCYRIESIRPDPNPDSYAHRTVLWLEKQSKIPVRIENYDWPRPGGLPNGELLEMFGYFNLQFNIGLKAEEFTK